MSARISLLGLLVLLPLGLWSVPASTQSGTLGRPVYKSPLGLAVDHAGKRAYVALHSAGTIAIVDLKAGKVLAEVPVGRGPYDLALAKGKLFVTCEEDDTLVVLDAAKAAVVRNIPVGQAPRGIAVTPDGKRVFVACHDQKALRRLDLTSSKTDSLPLPAWPERLLLHQDDLFGLSLLSLSSQPGSAAISLIETGARLRLARTEWLRGITNVRGLGIWESRFPVVFVAAQKPRTRIPTTQVAQGWVFTNALSNFSPLYLGRPAIVSNTLDDPTRSNADPSDVVLSADGHYAFISCAGADAVVVLRTKKAIKAGPSWEPTPGRGSDGENLAQGRDDLAGTRLYVAARLPTQANPRRLALSGDGSTLVVSNYLADSLTVFDAKKLRVRRHIPLGGPPPDAARRGQILFNSGRMTFHGQFTCASCHPDGGTDGLNWDLTRDGIGNFVNTRSLLGVKDTAHYGWYSTSPSLADRVTGTLRTLHRHEPAPEEVSDLVAYLRTLPPPRPLPQTKAERAAAARGRLLFTDKAGCIRCHKGTTFQDGKTHDVGTHTPADPYKRLDTPSLRGVARSAPYLHDGRAATLEEVFTRYNPTHRHGAAHRLTAEELHDLIAFLNSL
jgi:YVTN family beta-propeller protein